jgi:chorismate synthase
VALELITAGESHGPELAAVLTGLPAGLALDRAAIDAELARRQHGHGRGGRQKIERDRVEVRAGLRDGVTLGSPLLLVVPNRDWENWAAVMDAWAVDPEKAARRRLTAPRPGHADLAGGWKYGHQADLRNVLERASARETAARVAAGAVCRQLLARCGVRLRSGVLALGGVSLLDGPPTMADLERVDPDSPLATVAPERESALVALVDDARAAGDTLGGVVGAVATGVPPGLGSLARWDERLDGQLAQAVMAVQAVKAVAIGAGLEVPHGRGAGPDPYARRRRAPRLQPGRRHRGRVSNGETSSSGRLSRSRGCASRCCRSTATGEPGRAAMAFDVTASRRAR